ncbi:hypothetical protein BUALT_Bualt01G0148000 [Buddleja alternifolia]|uniref:Uncharacterized protein n=1 Tax=Buddleja alternifolia TaxID=168488 RepID=A0AAV6YE67_9LAMI|nr:hypothetical protein BUALT_Bualt01G0148000 [Buddleja alternifolia]
MDDTNNNKLSNIDIAMEQKQIADEQFLQRDIYFLKEQMRIHKENVDREMAELWNMVAAVSILQGRYGNTLGADRLISKQLGTVQNYFNQFTGILKGINLSEESTVGLFLLGLREEIQSPVKKFKLKTLHEAYCVPKLQEQVLSKAKEGDRSSCTSKAEEMDFIQQEASHNCEFNLKCFQKLNDTNSHPCDINLNRWVKLEELNMLDEEIKPQCSQETDKYQALQLFDKRLERPLDDELQLFGKGPERPSDDELQLFDKRPERLLLDRGTGFEMYNAPSSQEDLKGIQEPQVFDENPRNKLIEEHPQMFDEMPKSDYMEIELQVFDEIDELCVGALGIRLKEERHPSLLVVSEKFIEWQLLAYVVECQAIKILEAVHEKRMAGKDVVVIKFLEFDVTKVELLMIDFDNLQLSLYFRVKM